MSGSDIVHYSRMDRRPVLGEENRHRFGLVQTQMYSKSTESVR